MKHAHPTDSIGDRFAIAFFMNDLEIHRVKQGTNETRCGIQFPMLLTSELRDDDVICVDCDGYAAAEIATAEFMGKHQS